MRKLLLVALALMISTTVATAVMSQDESAATAAEKTAATDKITAGNPGLRF